MQQGIVNLERFARTAASLAVQKAAQTGAHQPIDDDRADRDHGDGNAECDGAGARSPADGRAPVGIGAVYGRAKAYSGVTRRSIRPAVLIFHD